MSGQSLGDPEASAPEDHDQPPKPETEGSIVGFLPNRDDFLDSWRVCRIPPSLVAGPGHKHGLLRSVGCETEMLLVQSTCL
jgi:hypothetical protein